MRRPASREQSCVKDLSFSSSHSVKVVILITLMKTLKLVSSTHSLCDSVFFHPFTVILGGFEGGGREAGMYTISYSYFYIAFF